MTTTGIFQVLATPDLAGSQAFYETHFGMRAAFVADWYVHLAHTRHPMLQIGLITAGHPSMPVPYERPNGAALVTMQVDNVDAVFDALDRAQVHTLGAPRDEAWGQRHFFAIDPAGFVVDVVMPIAPAAEYATAYVPRGSK